MSFVRVDTSAARKSLNDLHAGIVQAERLAMNAAFSAAESSAKSTSLFNDKTGATRRTIGGAVFAGFGTLSAGGMSRFLEFGTKPHMITAHGNGLLRFQINGRWVSTKSVNHPGTAERPFMHVARDLAQQTADYAAEYFVDYAIKKHNG